MPGEYDPGHSCLPQQPLHRCMFPQANIYPTMQSVTNPYEASIDGIRYFRLHIFGITSGVSWDIVVVYALTS